MDGAAMFLAAYAELRPGAAHFMVRDLSDTEIRVAAAPGVNTIAWLVWHMARTEDVVVSRFVGNQLQEFDRGEWGSRLRVPRRDFGVGHAPEDVREVSLALDLDAALAYWDAVGAATVAVVQSVEPGHFATTVPAERVDSVIRREEIIPAAAWIYEWVHGYWSDKPVGFMLTYYALGHNLVHRGEANAIRGLMAHPGR